MSKKVAIGLPVYNEENYIGYVIESLMNQTYSNFEVIVTDNCSVDKTFRLVEALTAGDPRFKSIRHLRNMGAAFNFEYALKACDSEYFMWLGGHDTISPNAVQCLMEILDVRKDVSMAMAYPHSIDVAGLDLGANHGAIYKFSGDSISRFKQSVEELYDCTIAHSMFRRALLDGLNIDPIVSIDHIIISKILWHGNIFYDDRCRYYRRTFEEAGTESTMEKMTGRKSATVDRLPFAQLYTKVFRELCCDKGVDYLQHERDILNVLLRRFGDTCIEKRSKFTD